MAPRNEETLDGRKSNLLPSIHPESQIENLAMEVGLRGMVFKEMKPDGSLKKELQAMHSWLSRAEPGHKASVDGLSFVAYTHATQTLI